MNLQSQYDEGVDALRLYTGEARATSASLVEVVDVVLDLAEDEGRHVVGIEVIGASTYLPLGKYGYDPECDTLTLGGVSSDPTCITVNGDIVTYWRETPDMDPIGVTLRQASKHLQFIEVGRMLNHDQVKAEVKKSRGRPLKYPMPERIDATPEEVAEVVLKAKPKKVWRYEEERRNQSN